MLRNRVYNWVGRRLVCRGSRPPNFGESARHIVLHRVGETLQFSTFPVLEKVEVAAIFDVGDEAKQRDRTFVRRWALDAKTVGRRINSELSASNSACASRVLSSSSAEAFKSKFDHAFDR